MIKNEFEDEKVRTESGMSKKQLTGEHRWEKKIYRADRDEKMTRYQGTPNKDVPEKGNVRKCLCTYSTRGVGN